MTELTKKTKTVFHREAPVWWDYVIPCFVFLLAFVCFDQAYDMKLAMYHSSNLLDCIFSGKLFDFYSYTINIATTTGYFGRVGPVSGAIYNIVIYLTMAVFALPVYALNQIFHFPHYAEILNFWGRAIVAGLSVLCTILLTRISRKISGDTARSKWIGYLFITSPILMFCAVIFNQYDIFSVTVTLLALLSYIDKKYYKFSILIALAVCYKLFAVFIFIPMILLAEKRIYKLIQHFVIALSLYGITTLLSLSFDAGYKMTQSLMMPYFEFYDWVFRSQLPGGVGNISIFIFCMFVIAAIAYWLKPKESDLVMTSVYFAGAAYISFFIFVYWHPQWVIILLPFLLLILCEMKSLKLGIILEIIASAGFIILDCLKFLDGSIFCETILVNIFHYNYFGSSSNVLLNYFSSDKTTVLTMTVFAASLIVFLFISYREYKKRSGNVLYTEEGFAEYRPLLYLRSLVPMIYMIFPLLSYFWHYIQSMPK